MSAISMINAVLWRAKPLAPPFGRVLLANTTQLGDLVICLPMAAAVKQSDPGCTLILLANRATAAVARCCPAIDEVVVEPDGREALVALLRSLRVDVHIQVNPSRHLIRAARDAGVPVRVGSLSRLYNWRFCNRLVPQASPLAGLNKRLLNLRLLLPLGIRVDDLREVGALRPFAPPPLAPRLAAALAPHGARGRRTIILSPALITAKSHAWPLAAYSSLIRYLDPEQFHWLICGTGDDRRALAPLLDAHARDANVTDLVGGVEITEFIGLIARCDGLIAGSTGPLHLAAALGVHTLGLFQSREVDVRRWHPVGRSATVLRSGVRCRGERRGADGELPIACPCIAAIPPEAVARVVAGWFAGEAARRAASG